MAQSPSRDRWLYGPITDLLLGCGGLYLLGFAAFSLAGPELRAAWPSTLTPALLILFSMPHYGATLVRVYDQRHDRRAYALFSIWATAALVALFAISVHNVYVGALLYTVYLTWSPWHYTGQNYGVALLFLRRRGVEITPGTKRLIYASFVTSYLLSFVVLHSAHENIQASPLDYLGQGVAFIQLGIPMAWGNVLVPIGLAVVVVTSALWIVSLARRASFRDLVPTLVLLGTQSLWFTVPMTVRQLGLGTGIEPLDGYLVIRKYYFLIALGHAIQYLWITNYYARTTESSTEGGGQSRQIRYAGKILGSGIAVWAVPFALFGPDMLGSIPMGEGLASLVAATVNLHHFVLDGAIWKLRNLRIAKVLIRRSPQGDSGPGEDAGRGTGWIRRGVWGLSAVAVGVTVVSYFDEHIWISRALARGDAATAARLLDRERWFGKDNHARRYEAGRTAAEAGDWELALVQLERSLELSTKPQTLLEIARAREQLGDDEGADRALREAIAASDEGGLTRLARDLVFTGDAPLARAMMTRAAEASPDSHPIHAWLGGIHRSLGDTEAAIAELRIASRLAPDDRSTANNLAWLLATTPDPDLRDPEEAIRLAEGAMARATRPDFGLQDTLSAAYAAAERYPEAVRAARQGLAISHRDARRVEALEQRLALYESGEAFVEAPLETAPDAEGA